MKTPRVQLIGTHRARIFRMIYVELRAYIWCLGAYYHHAFTGTITKPHEDGLVGCDVPRKTVAVYAFGTQCDIDSDLLHWVVSSFNPIRRLFWHKGADGTFSKPLALDNVHVSFRCGHQLSRYLLIHATCYPFQLICIGDTSAQRH
ncbi:hypothetical protein ABG067_007110 [Albugo candida]